MDELLIKTLCNIFSECKKKQHELPYDISTLLRKFEKILIKASDIQKNYLKDRFISELYIIKNTIQETDRSLHDKIFGKYLQLQKIHMPITYLFERFIRGITYFQTDDECSVKPIYHRLYSCGPYEDTHRQGNLVCSTNLSSKELQRRRSLIERCYIERLIYDELYKYHTFHFPSINQLDPQQNDNHLFRLDLTRKDFQTCFPNTNLKVSIEHDTNFEPVKLIIEKQTKSKKTKLTFIKTYQILENGMRKYDEFVECIKEEGGKTYIKTSSFEGSGKFR